MPPLRLAPLLLVAAGCTPATGRPPAAGTAAKHGTATESLKVGTQTRDFRLVVPKVVDLTKPAPLVFAFHGIGTDSTDLMPRYTKLDELAAAKGFVLVYPAAVGRSWGIAPDKVKADLAFFDALLAHLTGRFKIDADRVYVLGMSNGGYFAHLIGAERSKVVAVASHSGPLGLQTLGGVNAARKFPVMIVHGDQDKLLPVEWARENRDKYTREGYEVRYVEVPGLGHAWATGQGINEQLWRSSSATRGADSAIRRRRAGLGDRRRRRVDRVWDRRAAGVGAGEGRRRLRRQRRPRFGRLSGSGGARRVERVHVVLQNPVRTDQGLQSVCRPLFTEE